MGTSSAAVNGSVSRSSASRNEPFYNINDVAIWRHAENHPEDNCSVVVLLKPNPRGRGRIC